MEWRRDRREILKPEPMESHLEMIFLVFLSLWVELVLRKRVRL
jgi:hypothetical protein